MGERDQSECWALILAGGEGLRLKPLTRVIAGDDRPKQFCSFFGGPTLLDVAIRRAVRVASQNRTLIILDQAHERLYKAAIDSRSESLLVAQPQNRGTAAAVILGLLRIARLARDATVAIFPSAHYIDDEVSFMSHVESAFAIAQQAENEIILLGMKPESFEDGRSWIEPEQPFSELDLRSLSPIQRFWKNPTGAAKQEIMRRGCLSNTHVMVGRVDAFLELARQALPRFCQVLSRSVSAPDGNSQILEDAYWSIPSADFFSEVIALSPKNALAMQVPDVGMCELSEPDLALLAIQRKLAAEKLGISQGAQTSISFLQMHFERLAEAERSGENETALL